jgi:DNA-binding CsgD family transcriptional regulator
MSGARRSDEHSLLQAAGELWEIDCLHDFRTGVLAQVHALVGCDVASYNEIAGDSQDAYVVADPAETLELSVLEGQLERFGELVHQNPLAAHTLRTGDSRALRLSDFIGRRRLHSLELYDCIYRHLGVEYQIVFTVPSEGQLVGVSLSRAARDFDERELDLLEAVRRIALPVHRCLHDRARAEAVLHAVELEDGAAQAILLVHASGALHPAHARAERVLGRLRGEPGASETLREWLRQQRRSHDQRPAPLRLAVGSLWLEARYVRGGAGALDALSIRPLLEPGPPALRQLGLTRRQAEVLHLVWEGAGNAEIALALRVSEHTVRHHLEHIYQRLGVESRAAAARVASGVALAPNTLF